MTEIRGEGKLMSMGFNYKQAFINALPSINILIDVLNTSFSSVLICEYIWFTLD